MASLGLPPGPLAAYLGVRNANQDAGLNTIQQASGIQGLLAKINADRKEQAFRGELNTLGPNPTQDSLVQLASKYAAPKEIMQYQQSSLDRKAQIMALAEQKDADRQNRMDIARLVADTKRTPTLSPASALKQKNANIKAKGAVDTAERFSSALVKNIDEIIGAEEGGKQHPGLRGSVGYIDEKLPPFSEDQANAKALINALKSKTSVEGLTALRQYGVAPGSITEREWPIFQNSLATIDPSQGEAQFIQQLKDARRLAKEYASGARARYNEMLSGDAVDSTEIPVNPDMPPPGAVRRKK